MRCVAYSSNDSYKHKLIKTSRNCEIEGNKAKECHLAWYEVDELEDAINRYYPDL